MILYADTSALAKLLLDEEGSAEMRASSAAAERVISVAIAYVELRSALAAALRGGRIPPLMRDPMTLELERVWSEVVAVSVDDVLLRRAGELAERLRLRAYDAVHLAALGESRYPGEMIFACWDGELRAAARGLGYAVLPVG